jgi:hypothetical protein
MENNWEQTGRLLRWYVDGELIEGNEDGPHPWLVGKPGMIELQAVGSPATGRKGDATELEFMSRACRLDFRVAKPWGNVDPFDVLIAIGPRASWRVQVKLAPHKTGKNKNIYQARGYTRRGCYTKQDIDFLAAHIEDQNIWYIVPVEAFSGVKGIHFTPGGNGQYEKYREAWCLFNCTEKERGRNDIPALCRCKQLPVCCATCPQKY